MHFITRIFIHSPKLTILNEALQLNVWQLFFGIFPSIYNHDTKLFFLLFSSYFFPVVVISK